MSFFCFQEIFLSVSKTKFVKMSPMDPLFVTDSHQALSRQYFLGKLKFILQLCGYDPTLYNGHSFRSGAATSAGKALVEDHMITILGR
jgi:site-specific recombinase XerD